MCKPEHDKSPLGSPKGSKHPTGQDLALPHLVLEVRLGEQTVPANPRGSPQKAVGPRLFATWARHQVASQARWAGIRKGVVEAEASSQDRSRNASLAKQGRALADGTWQRGTGALHDLSRCSLPQLHIQRKTQVWRLSSGYQATEPKQGARPDSSSYLWLAGCFVTFWSRRWAEGGRTAPTGSRTPLAPRDKSEAGQHQDPRWHME